MAALTEALALLEEVMDGRGGGGGAGGRGPGVTAPGDGARGGTATPCSRARGAAQRGLAAGSKVLLREFVLRLWTRQAAFTCGD